MTTPKPGCISECEWVDNNPQHYRNAEHQELVKTNIRLRYRTQRLINKIDRVLKDIVKD